MAELAKHYQNGFIRLSEISDSQAISLKYLEQIVRPLKRARYIKSARGAGGGYMLARPPEEITVGEIVTLLEGGGKLVDCASKRGICDRYENCLAREVWEQAERAMMQKLQSFTLSDLVPPQART
jgi:Rrf2 family protein